MEIASSIIDLWIIASSIIDLWIIASSITDLWIIASSITDLAKTCRKNDCDTIITEILPRGDKLNKKTQEVNTTLHKLYESENLWIIKDRSQF